MAVTNRYLRQSLRLLALLAIVATGGCRITSRLQAQSRVNPVSMAAYPTPTQCPVVFGSGSDTRVGAIDLDCFVFPETKGVKYADDGKRRPHYWVKDRSLLAYSQATNSRVTRNRLTSILIKQSDDICVQELGRLTANEATTNATLSVLGTSFSTAASIVSGELAKSILAGASSVAGASRDHINVHVYRNTIAQAVSQVIAAERRTMLGEIQKRYGDQPVDWSIDDAIRDVNAYHAQCSFYKGLELLLKAADDRSDLASYRAALARQSAETRSFALMVQLETARQKFGADSEVVKALEKQYVAAVTTATGRDKKSEPAAEALVVP